MAKASDLITQLVAILPNLTGLFSDQLSVSSLLRTGSTVTVVTTSAHGLTTGNLVNISGVECPVVVTELISSGTVASGIVDINTPHDLTENWQDTIAITGADQEEYNGESLPLLTVANRYQFTYTIPEGAVTPATGDLILLYDGRERGYNGNFVVTVIDATTFTYEITGTPYATPTGIIYVRTRVRISGAVDIERALEAYTQQTTNKLWGFVVKGSSTANKDRNVYSDAKFAATAIGTQQFRQRRIQDLYLYVVTPCVNEIAARQSNDLMEDLLVPIFKSILGFAPSNVLTDTSQFTIYYDGDQTYRYDKAYYCHEFRFGCINDITYDDTVLPPVNVAFRDVSLVVNNLPDPFTLGINLDDEPYTGPS